MVAPALEMVFSLLPIGEKEAKIAPLGGQGLE